MAEILSKFSRKYKETDLPVYVQVNSGLDPNKYGCKPEEAFEIASAITQLPGLRLIGLMTVAPLSDETDSARRAFKGLRILTVSYTHLDVYKRQSGYRIVSCCGCGSGY